MNLILALYAMLVLLSLPMAGCSSSAAKAKDRRVEHWTQRPPTGPDTSRIVDKDGNPSFGPK